MNKTDFVNLMFSASAAIAGILATVDHIGLVTIAEKHVVGFASLAVGIALTEYVNQNANE